MDQRHISRELFNEIYDDAFERKNRDNAYDILDEMIEESVYELNQEETPNLNLLKRHFQRTRPHWKNTKIIEKGKGFSQPTRWVGHGLNLVPVYSKSNPGPELIFDYEKVPVSPTENRPPSPLSRLILDTEIDNLLETIGRSAAIQAHQDRRLQRGEIDDIMGELFEANQDVNRQLDLGMSLSPNELMGGRKKRRTKKKIN